MSRVRILPLIALLTLGCGQTRPPTFAGKPLDHWLKAVHAADAKERKTAVFELGNAGPLDPAVAPALLAALQDPDERVRAEAVAALLKFHPEPEGLVAALRTAAQDPSEKVRLYAAKGLQKLISSAGSP